MTAYLKLEDSEKIFIDCETIIISNQKDEVYKTIVLKNSKVKQCAIIKKSSNHFQIIDLFSSFSTRLIARGEREVVFLKPLIPYDLHDSDKIQIGETELIFALKTENDDKGIIKKPLFIPETQEMEEDSVGPTQSEISQEHLELPETQYYQEFSQNLFDVNSQQIENDFKIKNKRRSSDYYDSSEDEDRQMPKRVKFFNSPTQVETSNNKSLNSSKLNPFFAETQPDFSNLPKATRLFTKQQEEIKPKTRPIYEFESTESIIDNFCAETQPVQVTITNRKKRGIVKVERDLKFEMEFKEHNKNKVNSILLSDEEEDEYSFSSYLKKENKVMTQSNDTSFNSSANMPEMPSQVFNPDFLSLVNASQKKDGITIDLMENNQIENESQKPSKQKFFAENLKNKRPKQKKLFKYKYDLSSSEDD